MWTELINFSIFVIGFIPLLTGYISSLFTDLLPQVKTILKSFSQLLKVVGFLGGCAKWLKGFYKTTNKQLYTFKYHSTRITTLVTADPRRVSEWSQTLKQEILEEGVPRAGTICLFVPRTLNHYEDSTGTVWFYLMVFVAPNKCLCYKMDGEVMIPTHLGNLFGMSSLVFYLEDMNKFQDMMQLKYAEKWTIPRNFINLEILLQCHKRPELQGIDFLKMTEHFLWDFSYKVPEEVVSSDWEKEVLSEQQIEYFTMRVYAGYLVAAARDWTTGTFLISNFANRPEAVEEGSADALFLKIKDYEIARYKKLNQDLDATMK